MQHETPNRTDDLVSTKNCEDLVRRRSFHSRQLSLTDDPFEPRDSEFGEQESNSSPACACSQANAKENGGFIKRKKADSLLNFVLRNLPAGPAAFWDFLCREVLAAPPPYQSTKIDSNIVQNFFIVPFELEKVPSETSNTVGVVIRFSPSLFSMLSNRRSPWVVSSAWTGSCLFS
jgi:hypothetical protein